MKLENLGLKSPKRGKMQKNGKAILNVIFWGFFAAAVLGIAAEVLHQGVSENSALEENYNGNS
jgi:hypothetical protein